MIGCSLPQSKVRAVFMVIANTIREQVPEMLFVQGYNPVQIFAPTAFDPTLRNAVFAMDSQQSCPMTRRP
jgi:hypothetical protein